MTDHGKIRATNSPGITLLLIALSLTIMGSARSSDPSEESGSVRLGCSDSESVRAGGFIWSDGLTSMAAGDR